MTEQRILDIATQGLQIAVDSTRQHFEWEIAHHISHCESPIEQLFAVALTALTWNDPGLYSWAPQVTVGGYRLDFVVKYADPDQESSHPATVAIECDGHDFHERTKQQAQRDKARDRELTRQGFHVLRFTGSEIYADPISCGREALELASDIYWQRFTGPKVSV